MEIYTPRIMKESAQGFAAFTLEDEMFANREIQLTSEVNHEQAAALVNQLICLAREDRERPITLYINSPGGIVSEGMTIFDMMKAVPCPIHTVCTGMAASMAALIFAVGDRRYMLPHSTVMVHEPFVTQTGGNMFDLKNRTESLQRMRENYCKILSERSGRPIDEVYEALHNETYFTPQEAIEFGLCDEILEKINL